MRRTAFLINIARGSVVAEDELVEALQAATSSMSFTVTIPGGQSDLDDALTLSSPPTSQLIRVEHNARVFEIFDGQPAAIPCRRPDSRLLRRTALKTKGWYRTTAFAAPKTLVD
ncbi:hypothetical protein GGD66_002424 [Bradyrhizobium sp. CIR48]|uniref:NAD(P)-dependent oxidoreductase n=1 Tax=Bradyrhizobium sp. CIR48 TaxID=2663840 RepID=UPI0017A34791|nr:hypothetical protein [Bradyrhizobium sp. CIR48]